MDLHGEHAKNLCVCLALLTVVHRTRPNLSCKKVCVKNKESISKLHKKQAETIAKTEIRDCKENSVNAANKG
jgi:hypothetical protein